MNNQVSKGSGEPHNRTNGSVVKISDTYHIGSELSQITSNAGHDADPVCIDIDQLNGDLVKQSKSICESVRSMRDKYRTDGIPYTSDIIPPFCSIKWTLHANITNLFTCYSNTLSAALFCEAQYIKKFEELEALSAIVNGEKQLVFDFLSKNGLIEKFNEFCIKKNVAF